MKEFYVVLVTITLINCISLSRMTGPGSWLSRFGGWSTRPGSGLTPAGDPGVAILFAVSMAVLLVANTLFTASALLIAGQVSGLIATPWLTFTLSVSGAGLLLLPLRAWINHQFVLASPRLRPLLPLAAIEVMILTTMLILANPDDGLLTGLLWAVCAGTGSVVMVAIFGGIRLRMSVSDAPKSWQGLPLELVTAGILALALLSPVGAVT